MSSTHSPLQPANGTRNASDIVTLVQQVGGDGSVISGGSSTEAYGTVSVGTSALIIKAAKTSRRELVVQNVHGSNVLYIGKDASVTTSTGLRLNPGESRVYTNYTGDVYGIASAASTDVRYEEIG